MQAEKRDKAKKRTTQDESDEEEMKHDNPEQRKRVKVKVKRVGQQKGDDNKDKSNQMFDENGDALSFEGSDVEEVDDEIIMQRPEDGGDDDDWEDCDDSDEEETGKGAKSGAA